jgi:rhomboid family GlyGly-CTERM serine protease
MPTTWRPNRLCWGGAFALVTVGLQLWPGLAEALRFSRPAFAEGAVWQLLTAQWVHLSQAHAAVNAMAAVLLCWSLAPWVPVRQQLVAWSGGHLGVAVVLILNSQCQYYAGASGALHGVLAGVAVFILATPTQEPQARWPRPGVGAALLVALAIKLWVQPWGYTASTPGWLGIPTYYPAHAAGAAGGVVISLIFVLLRYGSAQRKPR